MKLRWLLPVAALMLVLGAVVWLGRSGMIVHARTDRQTYAPGETVTLTIRNWSARETYFGACESSVAVLRVDPDGHREAVTVPSAEGCHSIAVLGPLDRWSQKFRLSGDLTPGRYALRTKLSMGPYGERTLTTSEFVVSEP